MFLIRYHNSTWNTFLYNGLVNGQHKTVGQVVILEIVLWRSAKVVQTAITVKARPTKVSILARESANIPITNTKNEVRVKRTGGSKGKLQSARELWSDRHKEKCAAYMEYNNIGKIRSRRSKRGCIQQWEKRSKSVLGESEWVHRSIVRERSSWGKEDNPTTLCRCSRTVIKRCNQFSSWKCTFL